MSQSPDKALTGARALLGGQDYFHAWRVLGGLLRRGGSWSGREKNVCLLNTGTGRFADVSAAVGFDHDWDARAVALSDWDRDVDVDAWVSSRNGARVHLLNNESPRRGHYLTIRLEGVACNRDAIGTRVEVFRGDSESVLLKTLRAGEGFLSQSSKWLHIGLGDSARIDRVVVHWPGSEPETYRDLKANRRYRIRQSDVPRVEMPEGQPSLMAGLEAEVLRPTTLRIAPVRRLPLPHLRYLTYDGRETEVPGQGDKALLINLWASWCQPCVTELKELSERWHELDQASLTIVALSVEDLQSETHDEAADARRATESIKLPFAHGTVTRQTLDLLDAARRVIINYQRPLTIPSSFLIDELGDLAAIYVGRVSTEQLLSDLERLDSEGDDVRNLAVPFAGRWAAEPFPTDLLAIPRKLMEVGLAIWATDYLDQLVNERFGSTDELSDAEISQAYLAAGRGLLAEHKSERAIEALRSALRFQPNDWKAHVALARAYESLGRTRDIVQLNRAMLRLRPRHPLITNNLAWLLATSDNEDVRDPAEAVRLAESLVSLAKPVPVSALDTLAAAYASAGRFDEAVKIGEKALELAISRNDKGTAEKVRQRLRLYKKAVPYRDIRPKM